MDKICLLYTSPFTKHLGVDIVSIDKGNVCVSLTIKHEHTNVYGIAHGGVIMSLCDMAMGAACLSVGKKDVYKRQSEKWSYFLDPGAVSTYASRLTNPV